MLSLKQSFCESVCLFKTFESAWKESNLQPASYENDAQTIELHAGQVRLEGFEPTLGGVKVRCATATPQPHKRVLAMRFKSVKKIWQSVIDTGLTRIIFSSDFLFSDC